MNTRELIEHYEIALYNLEHNLNNEQNRNNQLRYKAEINVVKSTLEALRKNPCDNCIGPALAISHGYEDMRTKPEVEE